jgi:predicted esterase
MFFQAKNRKIFLFYLSFVVILVNIGSVLAKSNILSAATEDTFITWTYMETPMGLYLPAKTDKQLPAVMFLHGCHNDPISKDLWIISALNEIEPCAVFLPTAPETQNTQYSCADWGGTYDDTLRPQMINAIHELDSLITVYGFDTNRQYLYGESMGGEGVFRLLMDFPGRFAGAVDAAGYTLNKGAANMAKTPLWILIGEADEMSPVDSSRAIYNSILNAGGTVKYTEYPDLGHVAGIENARVEPGLLEWLLYQNRSTSVINKAVLQTDPIAHFEPFGCKGGYLQFSSSLPAGSVVTLFDLNGQKLYATNASKNAIQLPIETTNKIILWKVSNSQNAVYGKTPILQQ